ncbi:hypothetical protein [Mucisphaera sp.]|uniref:hypothetical protein n=1 Tax=Mucisphaera sp. TaxID=2913024 RepID=UPI003D0998DD
MNFSLDRDLLAYEPMVFVDVPFAAQERVSVSDGVLDGTMLSSLTAEFVSRGVDPGSVVLINRVAHEVIAVTDEGTLEITGVRNAGDDACSASFDGEGLSVIVRTFAPQAALVHDLLLRLLGLEGEGGLNEDAVVSLGSMARLECLGALELIYSAAVSMGSQDEALLTKATLYRERFRRACRATSIEVDVDGDGRADERRRLGLISLFRV